METESDSILSYVGSLEKKDWKTIKADFYYQSEDLDGTKLHAYRHVELDGNLKIKRIYSHKDCSVEHKG